MFMFAPKLWRPVLTMLLLSVAAQWRVSAANTNDPFCEPLNTVGKQGPGTRRMVVRLRELLEKADPSATPFLNDLYAEQLRVKLNVTTNAQERFRTGISYALELLRAGKSTDALRQFDDNDRLARGHRFTISAGNEAFLRVQRGVAWMRVGEQQNCLLNHSAESCLFPIHGRGVHELRDGSTKAIEIFNEQLAKWPNDLATRWLLNVAHMTLGSYPDKLPPKLLIPPKAFASEYNLPRFPEAAAAAGVDVDDLAGGCITEDFDGDGLLDVMASSSSLRGQLRFFHNNGDGTFQERTRGAGLFGLTGGLNIVQTDYNNDGRPDVFVLRGAWLGKGGHHPNSLLRNNGNGTFEDVTEEAGLLSFHPTQTCTWLDFDNDGWLDVFIGNESTEGDPNPCELFRNNGDGTFTECAQTSGVAAVGYVKGVTSGDYDNDGRPDLYISSRDQFNVLLHNNGPAPGHSKKAPAWSFADVTDKAGVPEPMISFPTWFFDCDNDGWLDIFVSSYSATLADIAADYLGQSHKGGNARLYRNNHDGTFTDVSKPAGVARVLHTMGCNFGDFDNDGWLDFYAGTGDPDFSTLIPNRAFRNNNGTNFQEVTSALGIGHLQKGHGVAFADLDNNGSQDIYEVIGGAYAGDNYRNALFVNPGNSNHWLTLKLEGVKSNRAAVGARIRVIARTSNGTRSIYRTVTTGSSFGANPLRQEIGLGDAQKIEAIEIFWPLTEQTQRVTGVTMDRFYKIREGVDRAELWMLKRFQLATQSTNSAPHQHTLH
jgi:hypothetical protein